MSVTSVPPRQGDAVVFVIAPSRSIVGVGHPRTSRKRVCSMGGSVTPARAPGHDTVVGEQPP